MKQNFLPYEESLAMKQLGFNEPCFARYGDTEEGIGFEIWDDENYGEWSNEIKAPLWQQALDFFRTRGYFIEIFPGNNHQFITEAKQWYWLITKGTSRHSDKEDLTSYEEARLDCIRTLIKIEQNESNYSSK